MPSKKKCICTKEWCPVITKMAMERKDIRGGYISLPYLRKGFIAEARTKRWIELLGAKTPTAESVAKKTRFQVSRIHFHKQDLIEDNGKIRLIYRGGYKMGRFSDVDKDVLVIASTSTLSNTVVEVSNDLNFEVVGTMCQSQIDNTRTDIQSQTQMKHRDRNIDASFNKKDTDTDRGIGTKTSSNSNLDHTITLIVPNQEKSELLRDFDIKDEDLIVGAKHCNNHLKNMDIQNETLNSQSQLHSYLTERGVYKRKRKRENEGGSESESGSESEKLKKNFKGIKPESKSIKVLLAQLEREREEKRRVENKIKNIEKHLLKVSGNLLNNLNRSNVKISREKSYSGEYINENQVDKDQQNEKKRVPAKTSKVESCKADLESEKDYQQENMLLKQRIQELEMHQVGQVKELSKILEELNDGKNIPAHEDLSLRNLVSTRHHLRYPLHAKYFFGFETFQCAKMFIDSLIPFELYIQDRSLKQVIKQGFNDVRIRTRQNIQKQRRRMFSDVTICILRLRLQYSMESLRDISGYSDYQLERVFTKYLPYLQKCIEENRLIFEISKSKFEELRRMIEKPTYGIPLGDFASNVRKYKREKEKDSTCAEDEGLSGTGSSGIETDNEVSPKTDNN